MISDMESDPGPRS